jgi:hypothetical protein
MVEPQIVVLDVAGSSPVGHPTPKALASGILLAQAAQPFVIGTPTMLPYSVQLPS